MSSHPRTSSIGSVVAGAAQALAVVLVLGTLATRPAEAAPCPGVRVIDARLAAKADEGGLYAVRQFVVRTRTVYGFDLPEALFRIERYRSAVAQCRAAPVAEAPAEPSRS